MRHERVSDMADNPAVLLKPSKTFAALPEAVSGLLSVGRMVGSKS
jgi:hypothetical protein